MGTVEDLKGKIIGLLYCLLETLYRRTRLPADLKNFKDQSRLVAKLITSSRRSYFKSLVSSQLNNPKNYGPLSTLSLPATLLPLFLIKPQRLLSRPPFSTSFKTRSPNSRPLFPTLKTLNLIFSK